RAVISGVDLIVTTPERISQIVTEAVSAAMKRHVLPVADSLPDRIGIDEVCEITGYKKATVYRLTSEDKIPHSKYGNKLVFSRKELASWLEDQTIHSSKFKDEVAERLMKQARKGRGAK